MSYTTVGIERNINDTERILSAAGGALLMYIALRRAPLSLLLSALGGALLYRALSAKSVVYDALGISTRAQAMLAPEPTDTESMIDSTVEDSFPASDPPGWHTGTAFTQVDK